MKTNDIVEMLKNSESVQIHPVGNSMMPFIYPGKDEVVISPVTKELRKYDIILFRSQETGVLTLHRILDIKENIYYACGDNQYRLEPVNREHIFGIVTEIIRNGKKVYMDDPLYRIGARLYTNNKQAINVLRKLKNRFRR